MNKTEREVMNIICEPLKIPKEDWELILILSPRVCRDLKTILLCESIYKNLIKEDDS